MIHNSCFVGSDPLCRGGSIPSSWNGESRSAIPVLANGVTSSRDMQRGELKRIRVKSAEELRRDWERSKRRGRKGRGRLERRRDFAGVNSFRRENLSGLINSMVHEIDVLQIYNENWQILSW